MTKCGVQQFIVVFFMYSDGYGIIGKLPLICSYIQTTASKDKTGTLRTDSFMVVVTNRLAAWLLR